MPPDLVRVLRSALRGAALDALAVLLPVDCAGCGTSDRGVCERCRAALAPHTVLRSVGGDRPLRVWAAGDYAGVRRRVLLALKEEGRTDAVGALVPGFAEAVRRALDGIEHPETAELCAVPPSRAGRRRRGYDPVRMICSRAGVRLRRGLIRTRGGAQQKGLGAGERTENAVGSLRGAGAFAGRRVLIVDDIVTTGATLLEARRALEEAGATVLGAVVCASTPRLHRDPVRHIADPPNAPGDRAGEEG